MNDKINNKGDFFVPALGLEYYYKYAKLCIIKELKAVNKHKKLRPKKGNKLWK